VNQLFDVIRNAHPTNNNAANNLNINAVSVSDLREDVVVKSGKIEREIIKENFPNEKDGYLVVSKVIED